MASCTAQLEESFCRSLEHIPSRNPQQAVTSLPKTKSSRGKPLNTTSEELLSQLSRISMDGGSEEVSCAEEVLPLQARSGDETRGAENQELEVEVVDRINLIVNTLVSLGQQKRIISIYVKARSAGVEESLTLLGGEGLRNPDDWSGISVDWEALQERITLWLRFSVVVVRTLFVRELHLVSSIFHPTGVDKPAASGDEVDHRRMQGIASRAFDGTVAPCMSLLLNFAQAVAHGKLMPEKVFALLHMIDTVEELMLELNRATTTRANTKVLVTHMRQLLGTLVQGAREIFEELEEAVRKDSSKHVVSDGSVHPLTSYVFNYVKRLLEYDSAFRTLFAGGASTKYNNASDEYEEYEDIDMEEEEDERDGNNGCGQMGRGSKEEVLHGLWPGRERSDAQLAKEERRAAVSVAALFDALRTNLAAKAKGQYTKSVAQQHFFLMNNLQYVVHSMRQYQLLPLLGDRWARELEEAVEAEAQAFVEATWGKLAGQLKSCQLQLGDSGRGGEHMSKVHRHAVKDAFKAFNVELLEAVGQQSTWAVTDDSLRHRVRALVQQALVQPYQNFFTHAQQIPFTKNPHKYFKYQPEEVQQMTSSLFHA